MNTDFLITGISRVIMVDKDEYSEVRTIFRTDLHTNELIFNFSGKSTVYFNNKVMTTRENSIRFLPKGKASRYIVDREESGECILICFDTDIPISNEAFSIDIKNAAAIGNLFKKLFSTWLSERKGYYFECISLLYKIFAELQNSNYIPGTQYDKISPALKYIENNFRDKKLSISKLAAMCEISESYLKKLFIKKFGMPPSKYIIQMKINYASKLLRESSHSVTQIAEICGYGNICFFSRQFKEYIGVTPTEFKNKYKSSK